VQARLAVQAAQTPPLHTMFVPQERPFAFGVESTQTEVPVAHDVTPFMHAGFGLVEQARPAVQAAHAPPLQTRFDPQVVPFGFGDVASFAQVSTPVEQEVVPLRHGSVFVVQASPAVHALHAPFRQTRFVPQVMPFGSFVAELTQVC